MFKKAIVGGAIGLISMGMLFGRDAVSYVSSSVGWVQDSVKNSVPVKLQIERARKMIDDLEPEVYRNKALIVNEEVSVERLARRIDGLESKQASEKDNLVRMTSDLNTGDSHIYYAGHRYTAAQVQTDLESRFERFKTNDEMLASLHKTLHSRQKSLAAAKDKLTSMLAKRAQLLADIAKLEAQEKMVEVAKNTSEFKFDDSKLARTMQLVQDIQTRLEVDERMLESEVNFPVEIPVSEPATGNISERIAEYFGSQDADDVQIAEESDADVVAELPVGASL
ncbi:MAG: hypothetical protein R3C28_00375 [Pirellulaceae bacterium]